MKPICNYFLNVFFAGLLIGTITFPTWATANDAATLNNDVPAEVRKAIESALTTNTQAKDAQVEWLWARPLNGLWEGSRQNNSKILQQAITMANEGKTEQAMKAARFIENAARQGLAQAEKAKKSGPLF